MIVIPIYNSMMIHARVTIVHRIITITLSNLMMIHERGMIDVIQLLVEGFRVIRVWEEVVVVVARVVVVVVVLYVEEEGGEGLFPRPCRVMQSWLIRYQVMLIWDGRFRIEIHLLAIETEEVEVSVIEGVE